MTNATITEQYILDAMHQESQGERFPISFDDIWQASGYTNQRNAARFLTKRCDGLKENEHYLIVSKRSEVDGAWVLTKTIYLSLKAYRFFLSKSNTQQGDANLWYLLEVEDRYRENLERQLAASAQPQVDLKEFEAKIRKEEFKRVAFDQLNNLDKAYKLIKSLQEENDELKAKKNEDTYGFAADCERLLKACENYQGRIEAMEEDMSDYKRDAVRLANVEESLAFNYFYISSLNGYMVDIYDTVPSRIPELAAKLTILKKHLDKTLAHSVDILGALSIDDETPRCMKEREKLKKEFVRYLDAI